MDACPSQKTLRDFTSRQLDEPQRLQVAQHVAECEVCAKAIAPDTSAIASPSEHGTLVESIEAPRESSPRENLRLENLTETRTVAGGNAASITDLELGFLLPSKNKETVGRIGNYEVFNVVGRGGMGIVLRAFDESLHRIVAVKVLAPELASSSKARRRFVREARAAAAINHPNVITIHAVDEQRGMPYLVMEYVSGCTLRERIQRSPPLESIDVMRIGAQVASGLAAAHEQGVIHRDIKPSNVMLEDSVEVIRQVAEHNPPNLAKVDPRVPRPLVDIIRVLLGFQRRRVFAGAHRGHDVRLPSGRHTGGMRSRGCARSGEWSHRRGYRPVGR